jgi:hypothetical protein
MGVRVPPFAPTIYGHLRNCHFSTVPNCVPTQENYAYWFAGKGSGNAARSTWRNARSIASAKCWDPVC